MNSPAPCVLRDACSLVLAGMQCATVAVGLIATTINGVAIAHPMAQGALRASVEPTTLRVTATLSAEEISIGTLDVLSGNPSDEARIERYGEYPLQHLFISADRRRASATHYSSTASGTFSQDTTICCSSRRCFWPWEVCGNSSRS